MKVSLSSTRLIRIEEGCVEVKFNNQNVSMETSLYNELLQGKSFDGEVMSSEFLSEDYWVSQNWIIKL